MSHPAFPGILPGSFTSDGPNTLRTGAWLISYETSVTPSPFTYDGTLRIENTDTGRISSGDLYQRPGKWTTGPKGSNKSDQTWVSAAAPSPDNGIPVQGRELYSYYLRVTRLSEEAGENGFKLDFELFKYSGTDKNNFAFTQEPADSGYTATMQWSTAPPSHPKPNEYAEGVVKLINTGKDVARLTMGRVSDHYRKISVEIDTVAGSEQPLNNGVAGPGREDWHTVFARVGFECKVIESEINVPEVTSDGIWTDAALHLTMLQHRERVNIDEEWRYYIFSAKQSDKSVFGIMFDAFATDSDNLPREGIFICSHVSAGGPSWPTDRPGRFGEIAPAYFRTSLHELGHALGLLHNDDGLDGFPEVLDGSFMNRTSAMLQRSSAQKTLISQIKWNHADRNLYQLRHWPDVFIRPGGVEFSLATNTSPPIALQDGAAVTTNLTLGIFPLQGHAKVPLGAPVRIDLTLTNNGTADIPVPGDIGLKSNALTGTVTDAAGNSRGFKSIFCLEGPDEMKNLKPGESLSASMTLLRGGQGALFPVSGVSTIAVRLSWRIGVDGPIADMIQSTTVAITPPLDKSHAAAAHKLLTTPDAHLVLILGGDYLETGIEAIRAGLDDQTLRPHFAGIEAKRIAKPFPGQDPNLEEASKLVCEGEVVISDVERAKLKKWGVTVTRRME